MIDLDSVMEEYESGYAKAYKNLPDLVAELKAAREVVKAAERVHTQITSARHVAWPTKDYMKLVDALLTYNEVML